MAVLFLGVIRPDDSVELVAVRDCDHPARVDHNHYWPGIHKCWRWLKDNGFASWCADFSVEDVDRIRQAIGLKVASLAIGAEAEFQKEMAILPKRYEGIPWKVCGASRSAGVSCTGLVWLWLRENNYLDVTPPSLPPMPMECSPMPVFKSTWAKGDVVFFRNRKSNKIEHCAVCLGGNKLLHILQGVEARVDNGTELLRRLGMECVGALTPAEAHEFYQAVERDWKAKGKGCAVTVQAACRETAIA